MKIKCPHCEAELDVGLELYGKVAECGVCENNFKIPLAETLPTRGEPSANKPPPSTLEPLPNPHKSADLAATVTGCIGVVFVIFIS